MSRFLAIRDKFSDGQTLDRDEIAAVFDYIEEQAMRSTQKRAATISAAVAHDLNNELTIILSTVVVGIAVTDPGHKARPLLLELRSAAQRCAWVASGLLNHSARAGGKPVPAESRVLMEKS